MTVGILAVGSYLPPDARTNAWWPDATVSDWHDRMAHRVTSSEGIDRASLGEGAVRTLAAMAAHALDPFRGATERRVMGDGMTVHEMEAIAAQQAMERASVAADEIDVVLTQTPVPEQLFVNSAAVTHRLLGLRRECLAMGTESACNAFAHHLELACGLVASGRARHVLSIHSSAMTRVMVPSEPDSAWWGDGAAAFVVGRVGAGHGVLGAVHRADGAACDALVLGVEGRRWWEAGEITLHSVDREHTRAMLFSILDRARDAIRGSLAASGLTVDDVDFYAAHQGTAWLASATAAHAGLSRAKTMSTFPATGNLNSANIPYILAVAEREGQIKAGSVIVTFSGGLGETWSSCCLRWGRA